MSSGALTARGPDPALGKRAFLCGGGGRKIDRLRCGPPGETAGRIELHASITGLSFYRKLGYEYVDECREPDENLLFRLTRNLSGKRPEAPALS